MLPGEMVIHKLTREKFIVLGPGEKDEAKLGLKLIVRGYDYKDFVFYDFELEDTQCLKK